MTDDRGGKLIEMERYDDSSSSSSCSPRMWSDLQTDVLQLIAHKVHTLGILRLRAVCHSWRSSLAPLHSEHSIQFPIKLPNPILPESPPSSNPQYDDEGHLELIETTIYRISPLHDSSESWLVRIETTSKPSVFSVLEPLTGQKIVKDSENPMPEWINLLNHRILLVSKSYRAVHVRNSVRPISNLQLQDVVENSLKKVVVAANFREMSELLVMGLRRDGRLVTWRYGDKAWTHIMTRCGLRFNDIISYRGTFYATAGGVGHLVKFTSTFRPIMLVPRLNYGCGRYTHLLESKGELYLVDVVGAGWIENLQLEKLRLGVYKLDGKGSYWDYELDLQGSDFFLGNDGAFAVDKEDCSGCTGNCIYFMLRDADEEPGVFNMKTGRTIPLGSSVEYPMFYWPPPNWVRDTTASSSC